MFFEGPILILFRFLYFKVPESVGSKRFESVNEREREREREREELTASGQWSLLILSFFWHPVVGFAMLNCKTKKKKKHNLHVGCDGMGRSGANAVANEDDRKRKRSLCSL